MKKAGKQKASKEYFRKKLLAHIDLFNSAVATESGDWVVKGFIDIAKNIYTISVDTKVVSKIMELLLFPKICRLAHENGFKMVLCKEQNFYPDITFIDRQNNKFAVDLKSTYRKNEKEVNGMTLGAFTGYFRNRKSKKNISFPYEEYAGHFVLGVIYSRASHVSDERRIYKLDELQKITSVVKDFQFFLQEKYKIAIDRPGSGNTKNIGSVRDVRALIEGRGPFVPYGREVFDDYWINYLTQDMARAIDSAVPYRNLGEYWKWRGCGVLRS